MFINIFPTFEIITTYESRLKPIPGLTSGFKNSKFIKEILHNSMNPFLNIPSAHPLSRIM